MYAIPEKHKCDWYSDALKRDGGGRAVVPLRHIVWVAMWHSDVQVAPRTQ